MGGRKEEQSFYQSLFDGMDLGRDCDFDKNEGGTGEVMTMPSPTVVYLCRPGI